MNPATTFGTHRRQSLLALLTPARRGVAALALTLAAGCGGSEEPPAPSVCNGHAELCARAYDAVSFPGTHNAFAATEVGFLAPGQTYPITRQLAEGVRVLHLQIQPDPEDDDAPSLCHSLCFLGSQRLFDGFLEIRAFVQDHPTEVVTLLMETRDVTSDAVMGLLLASGLLPYLHAQELGAPWPTLATMLANDERVVALLVADGGESFRGLLDRWSFTWETPWDNKTLEDFRRCNADRGKMGNDLYVVDTYLEDLIIPTAEDAARVNEDPFLVERFLHCRNQTGALPNFAMVNFYEVGDIFHAVDVLNGFAPTPSFEDSDFPPEPPDGGP